jgi:drug/metabolite transporter (DMT)-like permease
VRFEDGSFASHPLHVLVFAVSFAMVGVCTALALEGGSNPLTVVTVRTLGTVALFLAYFRLAGVPFAMPLRERLIALAIGIPLSVNNYMLNAAIAEIPVPLVVLIFYLWPGITAAASWGLGKERFRWRSFAGLALAFAGVGLALNVEFSAAQAKGVYLAMGAAVTWSATFLLIGHFFHGRDTRPATLNMSFTALAVFVVATLAADAFVLPMRTSGWAGIAGVAVFYAFAMIGIFTATVRLGAARTGFFMNVEPVAAVVLAALILGQRLAPIQLAGAALVVAALFLFRPLKPISERSAG